MVDDEHDDPMNTEENLQGAIVNIVRVVLLRDVVTDS
jgi:hypothetical protein